MNEGAKQPATDAVGMPGRTALTRRYRAWYRTLPPGLQLVGLQLWLPLFFVIMFCCCYVFAFHAPALTNIPIGYVGSGPASEQIATQIEQSLDGAVDVTLYPDAASATEAVRHGTLAGAVEVDGGATHLVIASAHQFQAASLVKQLVVPALTALDGGAPTVDDLAPLPPYDLFGTVPLYLMLVICIGGYMVGMFIGLMGGPLRHRTRLLTLLGVSFVLSLLVQVLAGPVIGAVHGHFWVLWPLTWAWMFTVGLVVNGLSYFVGRFIAAVSLALFVFLSMPSSSGAYPVYFLPLVFQWLGNVVVGSGIAEMLKHILYGVGPGLSRGFIMMACYFAAGLLLTFLGKPFWERRRVRRILAGQTTMFEDAQRANGQRLQAERERVLARYGAAGDRDDTDRDDTISSDPLLMTGPLEQIRAPRRQDRLP